MDFRAQVQNNKVHGLLGLGQLQCPLMLAPNREPLHTPYAPYNTQGLILQKVKGP